MAQSPSIPHFLKSEMLSEDSPQNSVIAPAKADDGFASEETQAAFNPTLPRWQPRCEYKQIDIDSLVPGPSFVSFRGKVVNLYHQQRSSQMRSGAKGCWRLIVKDDTGAVLVITLVNSIHQTN